MNEENRLNTLPQQPEEQEIDLMELAAKVWAERKLVFKACGYAIIVGLIVAFSIPREYSTSVTLAPESTGNPLVAVWVLWRLWQESIWALRSAKTPCRPIFIRTL